MYLLILLLPLIGGFISLLMGHLIGRQNAMKITVACMIVTFFLSLKAFHEVALENSPCFLQYKNWFNSEMMSFSWGFLFDSLTVTMLIVVTSISSCVHLYSTKYMEADPHIQRFMAYLSLFTFFMIILVTGDNYFQLFLGWEGVGLCSYLLINFWYGRIQANKAAIKAMIVNRIGDIALALAIFLLYFTFKTIDYAVIFALIPQFQNFSIYFFGFDLKIINIICFCFFIAATGKSAQIGLHTWLPDAMEGPTPVSALIHAATMVTAGVFLIVRSSPIFEYAENVSVIITISGALTAFIAASIGLVQNDLKRVIAYSTCSQLGYMMIACGTSGYAVSVFHLTNHAFFKALLFLSAGSIIHALSDEQDMRKMGGLLKLMPFTYNMVVIGSLSLMGFPFLTGFYSKDLILEWTYSKYTVNSIFAYWLGAITAFLTAFYSMRLLILTFLKKPLSNRQIILHVHEPSYAMTIPLFFLSLCSIFIGYILKDMMVGLGTDFWGNSIFVLPTNILLLEAEFLDTNVKLFPVILSILGGGVSFIFYIFFFKYLFKFKISFLGRNLYTFLNRKWFFDKIYNELFSQQFLIKAYEHGYQNIDRGIIEFFGPNGIVLLFYPLSIKNNFLYTIHFDSIKKTKNFFNFFLLLLFFIFLTFFSYWYFFNYTEYVNFFKISNNISIKNLMKDKESFTILDFLKIWNFSFNEKIIKTHIAFCENLTSIDLIKNLWQIKSNDITFTGWNEFESKNFFWLILANFYNINIFPVDENCNKMPWITCCTGEIRPSWEELDLAIQSLFQYHSIPYFEWLKSLEIWDNKWNLSYIKSTTPDYSNLRYYIDGNKPPEPPELPIKRSDSSLAKENLSLPVELSSEKKI